MVLATLAGIIVAVVCVATIVAVVRREWALLDARREPVGRSGVCIEDLILCGAEGWEQGQSGCLYAGPYTLIPDPEGRPPRLLCQGTPVHLTPARMAEVERWQKAQCRGVE